MSVDAGVSLTRAAVTLPFVAMICPRCSFQNRKGTLACARCGETAPRALGVVIDSRPPAQGPRPGAAVKREVPIRGGGLRAISGGPARLAPPPRIRQATPHWARSFPPPSRLVEPTPAPQGRLGSAAVSAIHHVVTDPQWIIPPDEDSPEGSPPRTFAPPAVEPEPILVGQPATFGRRALAAAIDAAVIAFALSASVALGLTVFGWHALAPNLGRGVDFVVDGLLFGRGLALLLLGLATVIGFAYTTVAHALGGATLGKALLGLRVVTREGEVPQPSESAWRSVLAGLSVALGGIGVAVALVDPRHVTLHDRLVGTRVIHMARRVVEE